MLSMASDCTFFLDEAAVPMYVTIASATNFENRIVPGWRRQRPPVNATTSTSDTSIGLSGFSSSPGSSLILVCVLIGATFRGNTVDCVWSGSPAVDNGAASGTARCLLLSSIIVKQNNPPLLHRHSSDADPLDCARMHGIGEAKNTHKPIALFVCFRQGVGDRHSIDPSSAKL